MHQFIAQKFGKAGKNPASDSSVSYKLNLL